MSWFTPPPPQVGAQHLGVSLDRFVVPVGDQAAEVEHGDAIGDAHHEGHVALDDQRGDPQLLACGGDRVGHRGGLLVVHPGHGLVEEQQARLRAQRPRAPAGADALDALAGPPGGPAPFRGAQDADFLR